MLSSPSPSSSGQLSQLGASLYGPQSKSFGELQFSLYARSSAGECVRTLSRYESSLCFYHDVTFCRCTWLLGKGHGEQHANKPKSNTRHTASKSYRPHNRSPRHVPPYTSITKQVWTQRPQLAFTPVWFVCVFLFLFSFLQEMPVDMRNKIDGIKLDLPLF